MRISRARERALLELGLKPGANQEQIRSTYRLLAKECHPDLNPGDLGALARFRRLNEAYKKLTEIRLERETPMFAVVSDPMAAMAAIWQEFLPDKQQRRME